MFEFLLLRQPILTSAYGETIKELETLEDNVKFPDASSLAADLEENVPLPKKTLLLGIVISKESGIFDCLFDRDTNRNLTLPEKPTRLQKAVAFLLVLTGYAFWATRKGDCTERAYHRANASDILTW